MENLEQAGEIHKAGITDYIGLNEDCKQSFIAGGKWMADRTYSSEEVKEILIRFKSEVISNHHAQVTNINPYQWFKQFEKESVGRAETFTKDQMFMWAGYCAGRRMMNPTEDVIGIFEDWTRKYKEEQDA